MATAGAGLLPNPTAEIGPAIAFSSATANAVTQYNSVPIIASLQGIWDTASTSGLSSQNKQDLLMLGNETFPAITSVLPVLTTPISLAPPGTVTPYDSSVSYVEGNLVSYLGDIYYALEATKNNLPTVSAYWKLNTPSYSITGAIDNSSAAIFGDGDLTKFCQLFSTTVGYIKQANQTINSVKNSDIIAQTFSPLTGGMDYLTTGGLNLVSSDLTRLSGDLIKLGNLINLNQLNSWGFPAELFAQLGKVTGGSIPQISDLLIAAGLTATQIQNLVAGRADLSPSLQKLAYQAMLAINGTALEQVFALFGITTTGITNMAQLLNLRYILPNSYQTLRCPTPGGIQPVYLTDSKGVVTGINTNLEPVLLNVEVQSFLGPNNTTSYDTLKKIIPPGPALTNKAFVRSLQQIKGIDKSTLPKISLAMSLVETNRGLSKVGNLTTPVPTSVASTYKAQLGQGTGPNGTLVIADVLGVAFSTTYATTLTNLAKTIRSLNTYTLPTAYSNMNGVLDGSFGDTPVIIPSGPGAGTYTDADEAFSVGLIPATNSIISTLASTYASTVSSTNSSYNSLITSLTQQISNQTLFQINFATIPGNSTSASMSFTSSLHEYGVDVEIGGASEVLTSLANTASLSGQCLVSSLREGRNLAALQEAGIVLDTQLSTRPSLPGTTNSAPVPWFRNSQNWSKSSTLTNLDRNWGLLRSWRGSQIPNWGFDGVGNQAGTVTVKASGVNVDMVIVDAVIDPAHPEFAVNADGSGGSRVKYFNWYGLNIPGDPKAGSIYQPPIYTGAASAADDSRHACFVAGVAAGNTQGWAPNANIYNISPQYVNGGVNYLYLYRYILAWHLQKRANGNMNPTICNNSWGSRYKIPYASITAVNYRGTSYSGPFTLEQLLNYGITSDGSGFCIVSQQNSTQGSQIQECMDAGIIMVVGAGNNDTRMATPTDADYNNTLTAPGFNSGNPIYYARPAAPMISNTINAGAIGNGVTSGGDRKWVNSNCGPAVTLFAPGQYITSAWLTTNTTTPGVPTPVPDPRNPAYYIAKGSGTSYASPQVAGILACQLEVNPTLNQASAVSYITTASIINQIPDTGGGYTDTSSLQGAPNKYLTLPLNLK
jgi:hypothetical protein